ncbi:MAG: sigma 54-interacting transcriptional regulator, partial [Candidatus Poribacteria bacterium]
MIEPKLESNEFDILDIISSNGGPFGKVFSLIHNVSPTDIPVLIVGENGTLKQEFAREIHKHSKRKNGKLLTVNCANPDAKSLEIELFGCENRSNNSTMHRVGKIEQAYGGSIMLQEISEAPIPIQTRLLQVLQDYEIYRVGGHTIVPVDVRIIATTSHNLEIDVNEGKFRKDLFYRISVFPIIIPSLRGQYELIEYLLNVFLKISSKKFNKKIKGISQDAMMLLRNCDWTENISELKNVVEYLVKTEKTDEIQLNTLPKEIILKQISK